MEVGNSLQSSLRRSSRGEPFLSFRMELIKARGKDLTDYIWAKKPVERQKVPGEVISKCRDIISATPGENFSVLELGPGTGRFLREAILTFPYVSKYGFLEADANWAKHCEKMIRREAASCEPVMSVNASGDFSLFSGSQFDLVHAHAVLIIVRMKLGLGFISEMAKLLKPNGLLVFDVFSIAKLESRIKMGDADWATYYHPDWLNSAIESNGLRVVERSAHPYGSGGMTEYWFAERQDARRDLSPSPFSLFRPE